MSKGENKNIGKWFKVSFFIILLIGAGYFFGTICKQFRQSYDLILSPSKELLILLLWFLLALFAVLVSSGLIAVLVRPIWTGIIAFALSGLAMLMGWDVTIGSCILVLIYILIAIFYTVSVAKEMTQRIKFSVSPISEGQAILTIALILLVCGNLYFGYSEYIKEEGFSIPEFYIEKLMEQMEKRVGEELPTSQRRLAIAELREELNKMINNFTERIKSYEKFIPIAISLGLFMPLVTITRLLFWIPTGILSIIFQMLKAMGITKIVSETKEVQRLVIS
ncbi:MAG: hypothetical protein WBA71_02685 [Candidatus Humimicrobiia bacterium]